MDGKSEVGDELANADATATDQREPMHRTSTWRSNTAESLPANPVVLLPYFSAVLLARSFASLLH